MVEKSLRELDLKQLTNRSFTPSPAAWEDQVRKGQQKGRFWNSSIFGGPYEDHRAMVAQF